MKIGCESIIFVIGEEELADGIYKRVCEPDEDGDYNDDLETTADALICTLEQASSMAAELALLRKAIEDALHAKMCSSMRVRWDKWHGPCDCWKSKALKDGK